MGSLELSLTNASLSLLILTFPEVMLMTVSRCRFVQDVFLSAIVRSFKLMNNSFPNPEIS